MKKTGWKCLATFDSIGFFSFFFLEKEEAGLRLLPSPSWNQLLVQGKDEKEAKAGYYFTYLSKQKLPKFELNKRWTILEFQLTNSLSLSSSMRWQDGKEARSSCLLAPRWKQLCHPKSVYEREREPLIFLCVCLFILLFTFIRPHWGRKADWLRPP